MFGNGKTSVRGGVGWFVNRTDFNLLFDATGQQPTAVSRSVYYTTVNSLTTSAVQNTANITPISPIMDFYGNQHIESTYNGSLQVQQNLGFSTVLGVGWVFALRRHMPFQQQINYSPNFSQYNPAWASPMAQYLLNTAKNGGLTQGNESGLDLSANYFYGPNLCRGCAFGLGGLYRDGFGESTDYHSLQITLRRNMTKHLSYGLAYTYSKMMGLASGTIGNGSDGGSESSIFPDKFRNWGPSLSADSAVCGDQLRLRSSQPGAEAAFQAARDRHGSLGLVGSHADPQRRHDGRPHSQRHRQQQRHLRSRGELDRRFRRRQGVRSGQLPAVHHRAIASIQRLGRCGLPHRCAIGGIGNRAWRLARGGRWRLADLHHHLVFGVPERVGARHADYQRELRPVSVSLQRDGGGQPRLRRGREHGVLRQRRSISNHSDACFCGNWLSDTFTFMSQGTLLSRKMRSFKKTS